jgi:hypothetical protein
MDTAGKRISSAYGITHDTIVSSTGRIFMSFREQREMIGALRDFERKMSRDESEEFSMFLKRHKDDEELDALSMKRLEELYTKYYINRPRKAFIDPFRKP